MQTDVDSASTQSQITASADVCGSHTPEPWHCWQDPISTTWRIDHKIPNNSIIVAIAVGKEADARRIVACVNVCAGLSDEDLPYVSAGVGMVRGLQKQRDQLAGLLRECMEMADNWPGIAYSHDLTIRVNAALAKCNPSALVEAK